MTLLPVSNKYIPAHGNEKARLMVLAEAPSFEEVVAGYNLVGPAGREFDKLLIDAGINRPELWISNVSKYQVPPNPKIGKQIPFLVRAKMAGIDIDEQLKDLQVEINNIKPNCILALGGTALWALKGTDKITNWRGSIIYGMGRKAVSTFHPAFLIHSGSKGEAKGYWNRSIMLLDFKRAKYQSQFPELILPQRNLEICRSSTQLENFRRQYRGYTKPAVDIEARGKCIPNCVGLAFTPSHGLTIPLWNKGEIENIALIPDFEMVNMWLILADILANNDIVGQNFKYDQDKLRRLGFEIRRLASDTMLKSFCVNPELRHRLEFLTSYLTEEPYYKDEGMYEGDLHSLMIGCARDACVTKEIDLKLDADVDELELRDFYEKFLLELHYAYLDAENEGFYVNNQRREELLRKYVAWSEKLSYELYSLTDAYINVNSPKQVYTLLFEVLNLPRRMGTGEEELTALLNNSEKGPSGVKNPMHRRVLEIILEKRRVDKTIGNNLMALPDFDGKMKTTFYLCLNTGRTATSQLDEPIRPLIEYRNEQNKKASKAIGVAFQTMTKHGDIGQDVRSMYEPEKGYVLLQADSSQAEARVVFKLADDEEALLDIDRRDYHAYTASWFFGGKEEDYSKKVLGYEHPIRFCGKTLRHAGHLGQGKRGAMMAVNTDARKYKIAIKIDEPTADRALKIFHKRQPKIQQVFHKGIIDALANNRRILTAGLPFGIESKYGGKRQFFERWGDELFREAFSYIPQRTITDNTKASYLRIRKLIRGIRMIIESHDSLLFMVPEKFVGEWGEIIKSEMEREISFETCSLPRSGLIVPCELEIGYNYQELKKLKSKKIVEVIPEIKRELSITEQFLVR